MSKEAMESFVREKRPSEKCSVKEFMEFIRGKDLLARQLESWFESNRTDKCDTIYAVPPTAAQRIAWFFKG